MFLAAITFRARLCFNGYMWWLYLRVVQPCRSKSKAQNSSWRGFNAHVTSTPGEFISGFLLPGPVFPFSTSNLNRLDVLLNHHFCFSHAWKKPTFITAWWCGPEQWVIQRSESKAYPRFIPKKGIHMNRDSLRWIWPSHPHRICIPFPISPTTCKIWIAS